MSAFGSRTKVLLPLDPVIVKKVQMMIAQDQRCKRTRVTVHLMSCRHNLAVNPRIFDHVAKKFPPAWRLHCVSILLLCFCPLLEVRLQVRFTQVVTVAFKPALDLPKQCAAHLHSVFDPAARISEAKIKRRGLPPVRLSQIPNRLSKFL